MWGLGLAQPRAPCEWLAGLVGSEHLGTSQGHQLGEPGRTGAALSSSPKQGQAVDLYREALVPPSQPCEGKDPSPAPPCPRAHPRSAVQGLGRAVAERW